MIASSRFPRVNSCNYSCSFLRTIARTPFRRYLKSSKPTFYCQTIMAEEAHPKKWEGKASTDVDGFTADQIWPLVADFGNLHKWVPFFDTCYLVEGVSGEIGAVRYCSSTLPTPDGGTKANWVKEKLVAIDKVNRWYSYEIIESDSGIGSYVGTFRVLPAEKGGCRLEWEFVADPMPAGSAEDLVGFGNVILQQMAKTMQEALAPPK